MPIRIVLAACFRSCQAVGFYSRTPSRLIAIVTPILAFPESSGLVLIASAFGERSIRNAAELQEVG